MLYTSLDHNLVARDGHAEDGRKSMSEGLIDCEASSCSGLLMSQTSSIESHATFEHFKKVERHTAMLQYLIKVVNRG